MGSFFKKIIKETLEEKAPKQYLDLLEDFYVRVHENEIIKILRNKKIVGKTDEIKNTKKEVQTENLNITSLSDTFINYFEDIKNIYEKSPGSVRDRNYENAAVDKILSDCDPNNPDKKLYDIKFYKFCEENKRTPPAFYEFNGEKYKSYPNRYFISKNDKINLAKYYQNLTKLFDSVDFDKIKLYQYEIDFGVDKEFWDYHQLDFYTLFFYWSIYKKNKNIFTDLIKDRTINQIINGHLDKKKIFHLLSTNKLEFTEKKYFEVTDKTTDFLSMSISQKFNSCQNLSRTLTDDGYIQRLLSNVYDSNTKIAILYIDTPYIDCNGIENKKTLLNRSLIRYINGKNYYDKIWGDDKNKKFEKLLIEEGFLNLLSYYDDESFNYETLLPNNFNKGSYQPYMDILKFKFKPKFYDIEINEENVDKILKHKNDFNIQNEDDLMIFDKIFYKNEKYGYEEDMLVYKKINNNQYFIFLNGILYAFKTSKKIKQEVVQSIKNFLDANFKM